MRGEILRRFLAVGALAAILSAAPAEALDPKIHLTDYSLTNWGEDAGPFPFGIYAIAQDSEGYLWLGARTGLFRFDGTIFKKWSGSPLPDDRVVALCAGRDGSLWVGFGTVGGVTRIKQGQVTTYESLDGMTAADVNDLVEDDEGAIWAATYGGVARFAEERWQHMGPAQGLPEQPAYGVLKDSRGAFWVGTSVGVYRRRSGEQKFEPVVPARVLGFAEDASGTVWMSDREEGFARLESGSPGVHASPRPAMAGRWMRADSGSVWVSTRGGGVWRVRGNGQPSAPMIERLTRREGLASNEIHCLFIDRHGTLWIGTRMGLSRLQESNVRAALDGDDAFVSSVTSSPDGSVWIGTSDGLRRRKGDREWIYGTADGLPSRIVSAVYADPSGTLWAATSQGIAHLAGERFVPVEGGDKIRGGTIWSMTSDRSGVLWVCDQVKGLMQWKDGHVTQIDEAMTRQGAPHVAYTDTDDRVWIGLWTTGVAVYKHKRVALYSMEDGLPSGSVNVIYQDGGGSMWVGTSSGLARLENGRFVTFTANGFPQSGVVSIVEDTQGYLWIGLPEGLLRISRGEFDALRTHPTARLRYKMYGNEDGVPGTPGRPGMPSSTRQSDGQLWFVTSVGLAIVDPGTLHDTSAPTPVRIEGVVADGNAVALDAPLRLAPRTSRILIDYSILSLAAVGKSRFRYKLDNFDADWQDAGERRQASYTNLPPGAYRFRVASYGAAASNEPEDTLDFTIRAAFYQTTAFKIAVVIAIGLATWALWQLRLRTVKRRFDLVLGERMRMGREIHDTLLQSLVGVALEFDDIGDRIDPADHGLRRDVQRIREQVEHYIREARRSIWNLRSPMLETDDLPTALHKVGEAAVSGSPMRLDFAVSGIPRRTASRLEEELLRVGQEAVSNAVRHSNGQTIGVRLSYEGDRVSLRVSDDGHGFDPSRIGHDGEGHWGVTSMRERAQQVGAEFRLVTSPGAGTAVEMTARLAPAAGDRA